MSNPWPYDAKQDDPLTAMRIPVVGTTNPRWCYLVAVCVNENPDSLLDHGMRPTDQEAVLIRSFIDFRREWYSETWRSRELDARPFDIDGTATNLLLIKRAEGDWAYRRTTWDRGPRVVPSLYDGESPLDLPGLLDRINGWGDMPNPSWAQWKTEHPQVFEVTA